MRLTTLATLMLTELIIEFGDYFSFKENLLTLVSFFDILKTSKYFSELKITENNEIHNYEYRIATVKFNLAPSMKDVINKLVKILSSESHLLTYIYESNGKIITLLLNLSRVMQNFLEIMHYHETDINLSKHGLKSTLNRCRISNLVLELISRFQELAGPELSHSFKLFDSFSNSSKRHKLMGGIIYFLFIVCFETFSPGLHEFVRLSIRDLDEIISLDPSLNYFNPELNLIRSILALNNRSDQYAIDCLLHFFVFDIQNLDSTFLLVLNSSLNIITSKNAEIAIKLIHKFGNQNLVHLFIKFYESLEPKCLEASTEQISKIGLDKEKHVNSESQIFGGENNLFLAKNWIEDFTYHLD